MNRDFVDTGSTVVPAEDQLLNPTLLLKSPQDAGQNDFANGTIPALISRDSYVIYRQTQTV